MTVHELFQGEFPFKSNDSLDTQITASIDRGDFHLAIVSLVILVAWSIYMLFYNSRLIGLLVSVIARRILKNGYIRIGSISFSMLGGKLMLRDFAFMTSDYTVRSCYVIVVFNYWTRFIPENKGSSDRRCLYVYLYGLDVHTYNRTSVYDALRDLFQIKKETKRDSAHHSVVHITSKKDLLSPQKASNRHRALVEEDDESVVEGDTTQSFLDTFWSHARRLLPSIKFNLELVKLCAGNHLLPRALILTCTRLVGTYSIQDPPCQSDKYQHKIVAEFANLLCSLTPVSEYAGQHAIEEPPKSWDRAFHLFRFGRGILTYVQDEPGLYSYEPEQLLVSGGENASAVCTWPTWALTMQVTKDCRLHYGPWADRQRDLLWHFFFPPSYRAAEPSDPPITGRRRVPQKFVFELIASTDVTLELFFVNAGVTESFRLGGWSDSSFKLSVPWIVGMDGFVTTLRVSLVQSRLEAQHLWSDVFRAEKLKLDLRMHYPREWNMPQTWDIELKALRSQFTMLFDYKRFFKGLIDDWTRGAHPDILSFVPCTYKFRVSAQNLNFVLLANDYNWVSSTAENANIAFWGQHFSLSFDLPFVDFLPTTVPITYKIEASSVELRLSLPETSTMLYVIRELHSRLRLVDRLGRLQTTSPFHIHTETMPTSQMTSSGQPAQRYWIDCAWTPRITLRIGFVYHPAPWASEYWRFLPAGMRPSVPVAKTGTRGQSGRLAHGRRQHRRRGAGKRKQHGNKPPPVPPLLKTQGSDSSSQSELEELALRGLRPEGSQTQGPTEDDLLRYEFDASHFAPDTVDVHLHIADAQLCLYGALLRHFFHLKENYFGCYQKPVDFAGKPISAEEYQSQLDDFALLPNTCTDTSNSGVKRSKTKRIIDPREFRPLLVRLSLEFHNIQAHLPTHGCTSNAPCPTAFLDCIGFEMDKRWHETKIQLMFSPILLCAYDQCKESRPKSSSALSKGRLQLMGFCLRGQGLFSHVGLPLAAETVEYAWLLELTAGRFTGQLTAPQLASIVHTVNGFLFSMIDPENQLISSRDFELCQHARPQVLCSFRPALTTDMLCPGETKLKYRLIRFSLDGLDIGIVETGACLSLKLDPVRLTNCNMHGLTMCNGLFLIFPGVRLVQYIRPVTGDIKFTKGLGTPTTRTSDTQSPQSRWLEAGSLSFGPVHVNVSRASEQPKLPFWQLAFLRRHDALTKRLWFLWFNDDTQRLQAHSSGPRAATRQSTDNVVPILVPNCGCYGHCSFFGSNEGGRDLFHELCSGVFKQRAVFPARSVYRPDLFVANRVSSDANTRPAAVSDQIAWGAQTTPQDNFPEASNPARLFGESLLVSHRLMHELHNPAVCVERLNGLLLMRDELITAAINAECNPTYDGHGPGCCEGIELPNEASESVSSATHSYPTSLSDVSGEFAGYSGDAPRSDHGRKHSSYRSTQKHGTIRPGDFSREVTSRPSSMSELLVPPDSDSEQGVRMKLTREPRTEVSHRTRLPSNLSLNSLLGSLTPSSSTSSLQQSDNRLSSAALVSKPRTPQVPPTPPPRRFFPRQQPPENEPIPAKVRQAATGPEPHHLSESRTPQQDAFDKFVDLRNQLHRPITESGLLRSAYTHHLSVYECRGGWSVPLNLNNRWRVCKHIYPGSGSGNSAESSMRRSTPASRQQSPRLGLALPPSFHLIQPGFSPCLIVVSPDETQLSAKKSAGTLNGSQDQMAESRHTSHSNASVWLQGPVNLLLSPLFTEALERYVRILVPVMAGTSASTVVDSMHSNCVKLRARQTRQTDKFGSPSTPTTEQNRRPRSSLVELPVQTTSVRSPIHRHSGSLAPPYPSPSAHKISAPGLFYSTNRSNEKRLSKPMTELSEQDIVEPGHSLQLETSSLDTIEPIELHPSRRRQSMPNSRANKDPCTSIYSGKFASLSVERINICFLQLYAVEDLVHLDSLRFGLHDLTCVSLLTLCVDSVSFELLTCHRGDPALPALPSAMLRESVNLEDDDESDSTLSSSSSSSRNSHDPLLQSQSLACKLTSDIAEPVTPCNDRSTSNVTTRLANHPSLPGPKDVSKSFDVAVVYHQGRVTQHSRQPSAPPVLTNTWALPALLSPTYDRKWLPPVDSVPSEICVKSETPTQLASPLSDGSTVKNQDPDGGDHQTDKIVSSDRKHNGHRSTTTRDPTDRDAEAFVHSTKAPGKISHYFLHGLRGSELVSQLNVRRIHVQLRRLTRCGQFNGEVLLTAIPFESSRTFFHFESDPRVTSSIPSPSLSSGPNPATVWDEHSAGWIMFECGLERLVLSCNRRDGFADCLLDAEQQQPDQQSQRTDPMGSETKSDLMLGPWGGTRNRKSFPVPPRSDHEGASIAQQRSSKFKTSKPSQARSVRLIPADESTGPRDSVPGLLPSGSDAGQSDKTMLAASPDTRRNGFLTRLHVTTVWLNFPTPKRLPNKRRIELVRSDWNLLSTAAPAIKSWMDPSDRLLAVCHQLYTGMERRILAVTACLMTEAVNPKSSVFGDKGRSILHFFGSKELNAYTRHRTASARALRFDPSCQLLVVLRRYLFAMSTQLGQTEADRLLNDWLHDPLVPQNEFLQCGILSLTREWRLLVDLLALNADDLRREICDSNAPSAQPDLLPPTTTTTNTAGVTATTTPAVGVTTNVRESGSVSAHSRLDTDRSNSVWLAPAPHAVKNLKRLRTLSTSHKAPAVTDSMPAKTSAPLVHGINFLGDPGSGLTSRLLRMATGPMSPTLQFGTHVTKGPRPTEDVTGMVSDAVADDHADDSNMDSKFYEPHLGSTWETAHLGDLISDDDGASDVKNPILRRFLSDAKAPVADLDQSNSRPEGVVDEVCESTSRQPTSDRSGDQPRKHSQSPGEEPVRITSSGDRVVRDLEAGRNDPKIDPLLLSDDVRVTTADIEQAAHLSAQFQHVAYIQRFFSPLLESVGLSAKGIRRTTLMKKFGGFFWADGLLETFQIEIVASARNPMTNRTNTTMMTTPSSHTTNGVGTFTATPKRISTTVPAGRQSAFLCRNFSSRLTLRDVVDRSDQKELLNANNMNRFDLMSTTTKVDVQLNVDFLRQHVNLPLLRLVHQFVTMFYCARDSRKALGPHRPVLFAPDNQGIQVVGKQDSKGSSDRTEDTLRSRSSAYARFGDGSLGSAEHSDDLPGSGRFHTSDHFEQPLHVSYPDHPSGDVTSSSSVDKDPPLGDMAIEMNAHRPSVSNLGALLSQSGSRPPSTLNTPACWQRLFNYVELYTTVPKTKTVVRKPISTSVGVNAMMPTITEEDRGYLRLRESIVTAPLKIKVPSEPHQIDPGPLPGTAVIRTTNILGRRLLPPAVNYRPLNEDTELGMPSSPQTGAPVQPVFTAPMDTLYPTTSVAPAVSWIQIGDQGVSPGAFSHEFSDGAATQRTPSTITGLRLSQGSHVPAGVFEQFTYPWICSERMPLTIFVTAQVHQMAVSAVLSELNLNASVHCVHGSFTHSTQIRGRGSFTERFSTQSLSLHCGDGQLQLTERLPPRIQQVVCVKSGPSHALVSCGRSRQGERNACLISVGRVVVTLPHHPVRLHRVMQRQAKRITSTMSELLRSSPAVRNQFHSWNLGETSVSSTTRVGTTPTTCSTTTTTTATSDMTGQLKQSKVSHVTGAQPSATTPTCVVASSSTSPPLVFSLLAVTQGLTVNVALHPTLTAVYHIDPVYFTGQLGPRGYVDINLTEHSLSLKSLRPPINFPQSIRIALPRILTTIVRRVSSGGRYARGLRKEPMITQGLTAEQGLYLDIQVSVDTLEQNLTTDMLNYIVVVLKLFKKEINEIIQKMAGDEQSARGTGRPRLSYASFTSLPNGPERSGFEHDWLLSQTGHRKTKFTIRIRMKEIQLMTTTRTGAVKLEAKKIDVELTNRVSQASLGSNLLSFPAGTVSDPTAPRGPVRPSNLHLRSPREVNGQMASSSLTGVGDSLFIYAAVGHLCAELGYLDQDILYNERSPDFKTVALFKTSIALRSLLADEKFASSTSGSMPGDGRSVTVNTGEHDAFLISLNRPMLWIKPFTFDRAILMWMVYKRELAKWNEHMKFLISMTPTDPTVGPSRRGPTSKTNLASVPKEQLQPQQRVPMESLALPDTPPIAGSDHVETNREPNLDGIPASTLILQLNVEDLGVCLPINMFQPGVQSIETDSRTALVLTLDRSRISACYRDSLVSQGEFTDFCLRFDDEFNVGSDDWRPDWKRATVDVRGKQHLVILNACVVPSGTFSVCWRDPEKRAQWHLIIRWQMRGLDFHLDDNIGRRLKALFAILTRITGYKGAAPLLPTSAEEEEEGEIFGETGMPGVTRDMSNVDPSSKSEVVLGTVQPHSALSASMRQRSRRDLPGGSQGPNSEIASLDRYMPNALSTDYIPEDMLPDLSQVRSLEFNKHKQELLEAQYCQAFKRQKWSTLRRKGAHLSRSPILHARLTSSSSVQPLGVDPVLPDNSVRSPPMPFIPGWDRTSSSRRSTPAEWNFDRKPEDPDHVTRTAPSSRQRASLTSGLESIYFDLESRDHETDPVSEATVDVSSSYESMTGEPGSNIDDQKSKKPSDLWFDTTEANDFEQTETGFLVPFEFDGFNVEEPQEEELSSDSDNPDETIRPSTSHQIVSDVLDGSTSGDADPVNRRVKPPPPPRRQAFDQSNSHNPQGESNQLKSTDSPPKVHLKVDVQIHVDSGCCVLHPRLPTKTAPVGDNPNGVDATTLWSSPGERINPLLSSPIGMTAANSGSRPQFDCGLRSMSDLLTAYLERYKRYLLQDPQFLTTDLSVFYLPAVDIELHYNSMTEVDLHSDTVEAFGLAPHRLGATQAPFATAYSKQPDATKKLDGEIDPSKSFGGFESPRGFSPGSPQPPVTGGLKKQADLYVSCFLQKLPRELVVHPVLLDFLEQALENIPIVADLEFDVRSLSSDGDVETVDGNKKGFDETISNAASSHSLKGLLSETFPVHTVVHLHVQPSTVRLLCLPSSRMQCLMVLPFLDVVFSTKRDSSESESDSKAEQNVSASQKHACTGDLGDCRSGSTSRGPIQLAIQADGTGTTVRLPPHSTTGDIVSEGGLCVTAILKEFRISVFHPYGDKKAMRSELTWSTTWSGDSLTLLVRDIQFNLSRTVQISLVQLGPSLRPNGTEVNANGSSLSGAPGARDSTRTRYNTATLGTSTLATAADSWGLHRAVHFSGIFDIGAAVFTCDTRRTLEILDIPNAWYRSSLARRLFLGNQDVVAGSSSHSSEVNKTTAFEDTLNPPTDDAPHTVPNTSELSALGRQIVETSDAALHSQSVSGRTRGNVDTTSDQNFDSESGTSHIRTAMQHGTRQETHRRHLTYHPPTSNVPADIKISASKTLDTNAVNTPMPNVISKSTTLAGERPTNASRNESLKVASWHALPIFCVHLKKFDLNLYMGSAMGLTRLTIDKLFCEGRASLHSSGRKNTMITAGLGTCQFISEGGGVGGEVCLLDGEALVRLDEDPERDPQHSLDCRMGGFQLRIEYMNTNILLLRLNSLNLHLQDEWKLRDVARKLASCLASIAETDRPQQHRTGTVDESSPSQETDRDAAANLELLESVIGVPPVYVRVVGELNWDQAQVAIVRTTTPDLLRAVHKVREYFEEQVREGRMSLVGQGGSFGMFASTRDRWISPGVWLGWNRPRSPPNAPNGASHFAEAEEQQMVDQLLRRHWQGLLYELIKVYAHDHLGLPLEQILVASNSASGETYPVLGGSFQLSGRSLGIACFAGSFRSAPDWAIFNIQYPTACFETEAQREAPSPVEAQAVPADSVDPSEAEGWVNVRQVLSFDLGSHPHFQQQMAYVLRVRRGRQPTTRTPPTLTIAEWMEFAFRGADNTVVNFVRTHDPAHMHMVVQLSQFPIQFPPSLPATASNPFTDVLSTPVRSASKPRASDHGPQIGANEVHLSEVGASGAQLSSSQAPPLWKGRLSTPTLSKLGTVVTTPGLVTSSGTTASIATSATTDLLTGANHVPLQTEPTPLASQPSRSNPLRPPSDAEILFVLPSISLRITTDQRQTMAQPTLPLTQIVEMQPATTESDTTKTDPSLSTSLGQTGSPAKSSRTWLYGYRAAPIASKQTPLPGVSSGATEIEGTTGARPFSPVVKISFQTDFHGFVQLGLIDVPWLPTLINSYLSERLQEYELSPETTNTNGTLHTAASGQTSTGTGGDVASRLRALSATSSPMVLDARSYEIIHWSLSPECRWLLATSIGVPAFDRLLESIGFRKARITIPKWLQRGVMDHLDQLTSVLLRASLRLIVDESTSKHMRTKQQQSILNQVTSTDHPDAAGRLNEPATSMPTQECPADRGATLSRASFMLPQDEDD